MIDRAHLTLGESRPSGFGAVSARPCGFAPDSIASRSVLFLRQAFDAQRFRFDGTLATDEADARVLESSFEIASGLSALCTNHVRGVDRTLAEETEPSGFSDVEGFHFPYYTKRRGSLSDGGA